MSLSFALWFLVSALLLGFWVWTTLIVLRQKRAWKIFSQKRKLSYHVQGLYDTPTMSGAIDGYKINFFASEHSELDARSQRKLTAIEINLHTYLSDYTAIASGGMVSVVQALDINRDYRPDIRGWEDSYIIRCQDPAYIKAYLSEERLEAIKKLMEIEKAWIIILYTPGSALLRLDTPLALDDPRKIDEVVKKMIETAKALELQEGEERELRREAPELSDKQKKLDIDEDLLNDDIGFELEEDSE